MAEYEWLSEVHALVGREYGRVYAWDEVNPMMVRHWCEVMGIENPLYTDPEYAKNSEFGELVAPPAMLQPWCLEGLHMNNYPPGSTDENPYEVLGLLEKQGYASVVAVNSELQFDRYLRMGEKLYYTTIIKEVSEEKTTALGTGFFVTQVMPFYSVKESGDEKVGELLFRVFKFRPARSKESFDNAQAADTQSEAKAATTIKRPRPGISDDTRFFWDGCANSELRIQHCKRCSGLQHPPAPVCSHCQSFDLDYRVSSGKGHLYSHVVMHYPEVPPFDYPNPIGLIELDEGVRMIAGLSGIAPEALEIGQRVEVEFKTFDDDLVLPVFRPESG
ncbi:bifunctional MaoC family dehydratase N-terminal/OB-fold nucleic acid binding domain-containing protein [Marinobacterium weihaiense]|uniref:OB-fold domain-containing protein n=1 Tax=Marinobacterium weihaiense TaxID=2851016 RepID=A0ABS6M621_9GAMM|nr:OB-fold domain-containing protein [Marinobacterium weihaiense]MBV0931728.1 OB-fold domain-containing protein [Marinobacterium weihaiense]